MLSDYEGDGENDPYAIGLSRALLAALVAVVSNPSPAAERRLTGGRLACVLSYIVEHLDQSLTNEPLGVSIVGGQPGINALAASIYPTGLRATGVGWCLGIGRAGSIAGPVIAAPLIARHWSSEQMFLMAAVPAALSSLMVRGMAQIRPAAA